MKLIDTKTLNEKAIIMTDENGNKCHAVPISDIATIPTIDITFDSNVVKKMYDAIHVVMSEYEEDMANEVIGTILSSFIQIEKPIGYIDVLQLGDYIECFSEEKRNKAIVDLFIDGYVATPANHYYNNGTKSKAHLLYIVGKLFETEKKSLINI